MILSGRFAKKHGAFVVYKGKASERAKKDLRKLKTLVKGLQKLNVAASSEKQLANLRYLLTLQSLSGIPGKSAAWFMAIEQRWALDLIKLTLDEKEKKTLEATTASCRVRKIMAVMRKTHHTYIERKLR